MNNERDDALTIPTGGTDPLAAEMEAAANGAGTGWRPGEGGAYDPHGVFLEGWSVSPDGQAVHLPDGSSVNVTKASRFLELPPLEDTGATAKNPRPLPPPIVDGLLNEGEFTIHSGDSKSRKTMWCMALGLSVAAGVREFLYADGGPSPGFPITRKRVLYLNCELHPGAWDARVAAMSKGLEILPGALVGWFNAWQLRGKRLAVDDLLPALKVQLFRDGAARKDFGLIFLDALYNLFGGRKENDAGEMEDAMGLIREFAADMGAAIYASHHFAKGQSFGKSQIDRGSGSGVLARAPDNISTQTIPKKFANAAKYPDPPLLYQVTRRNFPSPRPIPMRFQADSLLWVPSDEEPNQTQEADAEVATVEGRADWVSLFETEEQAFSRAELIKLAMDKPRRWGGERQLGTALIHACEKEILAKQGAGKRAPYGLGRAGREAWWRRRGGRQLLTCAETD